MHRSWERVAARRRMLLLILVLVPTFVASGFMARVMPQRAPAVLQFLLVLFFAALYAWISIGFWTQVAGFFFLVFRRARFPASGTEAVADFSRETRTAVLIPVCNEPVERVCAGVYAVYRSLQQTGRLEWFDFFLLSDTNDPDKWIEEEAAWYELCRMTDGSGRIFYRNRGVNLKRKSGNIADFCRRWGGRYRYMIVLDTDSIMAGSTLVRMVAAMEAQSTIGILQTVPRAIRANTLFARLQQFSGHLYGPTFAAGLHFWQLGDAQYWGHNAIIRVEPFMRHCALPRLSGKPPFGGDILSHDFVEAALMRRAGWGVWLAYDLGGSYEELPSDFLDELKRDRRWCQGNMQHLRLLFTKGLIPAHRALFLAGAMAYVSGLIWFLFLSLNTAEAIYEGLVPRRYFPLERILFPDWPVWNPGWAVTLAISTAILLFLPKFLSAGVVAFKQRRADQFGDLSKLLASVMAEIVLSALLAPVRMIFHSKFVFLILLGRKVGWSSQQRGEDRGTSWLEALRFHGSGMALGLLWSLAVLIISPSFFWWLTPILFALILAVPVSVWSSRSQVGARARRIGLFIVPEEIKAPRELDWLQRYLQHYRAWISPLSIKRTQGFIRAVADPCVHHLHLSFLRRQRRYCASIVARRRRLREKALLTGPEALTAREKRELLSDPAALVFLHDAVWTGSGAAASRWSAALRPPSPLLYEFSGANRGQDHPVAFFTRKIAEPTSACSRAAGTSAADVLKSFADAGLNIIAVTLCGAKGCDGGMRGAANGPFANLQSGPAAEVRPLGGEIEVSIQGAPVHLRAWNYEVPAANHNRLSVLLLDADFEKNSEKDRQVTRFLNNHDPEYRLKQEILLGVGGVRMLRHLGVYPKKFHINAGGAFLGLQLYDELAASVADPSERLERVRGQCAFTGHAAAAGDADLFESRLVKKLLTPALDPEIGRRALRPNGDLSLTLLALAFSGYANAVSAEQQQLLSDLFPQYAFDCIPAGIDGESWIHPYLMRMLERHGISWKNDPYGLRAALRIPLKEIEAAHAKIKAEWIEYVNRHANAACEASRFTIGLSGCARYSGAGAWLFSNPVRLEKIGRSAGTLQIICAGGGRPEGDGTDAIRPRAIPGNLQGLSGALRIVCIDDFSLQAARLASAGADLWLDTAGCGTCGMRAALNGVPSLACPGGWWREGGLEGATGWTIGAENSVAGDTAGTDPGIAADFYDKLEKTILPLYSSSRERYLQVMRNTLAVNGSYFNAIRMASQYRERAYAAGDAIG